MALFNMNNPRYQRAIQKIRSLSPDQRAILDSAFVDREFAQSQMGRVLRDLGRKSARTSRSTSLSTAKSTLARRQRSYDLAKSDTRTATALGLTGLGVSALGATRERATNERLAQMLGNQNANLSTRLKFYRGR